MSFRNRRILSALFALSIAGLTGCRKPEKKPPERIAILPWQNLSTEAGSDWMGRALSSIVRYELTGSTRLQPVNVAGIDEAYLNQAGSVLEGYYVAGNGRIRVSGSIEALPSNRIREALDREFSLTDLVAAADAIARAIEPSPRLTFPRTNLEALRAWSEAGEVADHKASVALLEKSVAADPGFGPAWLSLLRIRIADQDRAGVEKTLQGARAARLGETERAEAEYMAAAFRGDAAAKAQAATALLEKSPNDGQLALKLALGAYQNHEFAQAAAFYTRAAAMAPADAGIWNQLAYSQAFAGDFPAAQASLAKLAQADPRNPNSDDTAGDIAFYGGDFQKSEQCYLRANQRDAAFLHGAPLLKAAHARLMTGDVPGADAILKRYLDYRSKMGDARTGLTECQWLFLTGRRQEALSGLPKLAAKPETATAAEIQAAVWSLVDGRAAEALTHARQALKLSESDPGDRMAAAVSFFLAQPPAPAAEWAARAERSFPSPQLKPLRLRVLVYALVLSKQSREAVPRLRQLCAMVDPLAVGPDRVLLAGALLDTGAKEEAAGILRSFPIPMNDGISPFAPLHFPRLWELRARAFGNTPEGKRSLELYRQLSGR